MLIEEIRYWSSVFRNGIENARNLGLFTEMSFKDFPNACCGDASCLLAQYLMENIPNVKFRCRYIYGVYRYDNFENIFGHAWLEVNNSIIVNITADQRQFKNHRIFPQDAVVPCYVEKKSKFHSIFEVEKIDCYDFYGLESFGESENRRLNELYYVIKQHIK